MDFNENVTVQNLCLNEETAENTYENFGFPKQIKFNSYKTRTAFSAFSSEILYENATFKRNLLDLKPQEEYNEEIQDEKEINFPSLTELKASPENQENLFENSFTCTKSPSILPGSVDSEQMQTISKKAFIRVLPSLEVDKKGTLKLAPLNLEEINKEKKRIRRELRKVETKATNSSLPTYDHDRETNNAKTQVIVVIISKKVSRISKFKV